MISYVLNLSNNIYSPFEIEGDGLDDAQECLEQLVGYEVRSGPLKEIVFPQTVSITKMTRTNRNPPRRKS